MNRSRRGVVLALVVATGCASCASDGVRPGDVVGTTTDATAPAISTSATTTTIPSTISPTGSTAVTVAELTPASLADEITAAERGIRAGLPDDEVAHWGRRQQRAYQALARRPEWDAAVRGLLAADVREPFDRNVEARRAVADHAATRPPGEPSATLPAWTIVEPRPVAVGYYQEAEATTGVAWQYLAAINLMESRMGRIVGQSSAGAVGPMQFLPTTWAACCVGDPLVPRDAILGAAVYLVQHGAPGDMLAALRGYNPNDGYVGAVDAYARNLLADERALVGYHAWEVYVGSAAGTIRLPVGYAADAPIDAAEYAATHPGDVAPVSD